MAKSVGACAGCCAAGAACRVGRSSHALGKCYVVLWNCCEWRICVTKVLNDFVECFAGAAAVTTALRSVRASLCVCRM